MDLCKALVVRVGVITLTALLIAAAARAEDPPPPRLAGSATKDPVTLAESGRRLEISVTDDNGAPVEGALVVVLPSSGGYLAFGLDPEKLRTTVTGAGGRATLESLPPGPWTLTVQARGFAPKAERRVASGPLEVRLDRGGVITGVVADAEGVPLAGARVSLDTGLPLPSAWAAEASRVETTTDTEGRFRLEGIGSRPVTVAARSPGYGRATREGVDAGAHVELFLFPGATLSGTVADGEGHPVEGAVVRAVGGGPWSTPPPSERTDAEGRFVMAGVAEGEYVVIAREGGRAPGLGRGVVEGEAETNVEIVVTEGGYVTGRLVDADGQPLEGRAEALSYEGLGLPELAREHFSAAARASGTFVLGPLPTGDFELGVSVLGYAPARREAWLANDGATVDLGDVLLDRGLTIRGRVVDSEGLGVPEARVRARAQSPGTTRVSETQSGAEGRFEVGGLEDGPWEVEASAPGFADARASARAGDEDLELTLEAGGEITGRVVEADGQAVPEAMIQGEPADGPSSPRFRRGVFVTAEDDDGHFVLRDVAAGTWVLQAGARGKGEASLTGVRVVAGRTTDVGTVVLARGGAIRGTVVDTDGTGVPGATVRAERDVLSRTNRLQTQSGSGGAFEIRGVPAGRLAVFASHPAFAACPPVIVAVDPLSEPEPVRLVLSPGGSVEGFALHRDGRPFTEGRVTTWQLGPDRAGAGSEGVAIGLDGWYSADHLPTGRTQVNLLAFTSSHPGMVGPMQTLSGVASREVEVRDGEASTVDFQLRDVIVAGQVTRGGQPAPGIRVTLMGRTGAAFGFVGPTAPRAVSAGPPALTAVTREDGRYELLVYDPGSFRVRLQELAGGQELPGREVDVPDVELFELNLQIADTAVSGVLVDAETGEPVADGGVQLIGVEPGGRWAGGGGAGPDGRFTVTVEPGEYRLNAHARGRKAVSMDVSVGPSGLDGLRIEMERGLELAGRVVDPSGRPVGGVYVSVTDGARPGPGSQTLPDGTFRLDGLDDRAYVLATGAELTGFAIRHGVRPAGEPVTLRLEPGGRLEVRVLDPAGQPVKDAYPWVRGVGGVRLGIPGLRSGPTDITGSVEIPAPAGDVEVEVRTETQTGTGTATVRAGETQPLTIVLQTTESSDAP